MKVYRIKHKPSGLYYNRIDNDENEKGMAFESSMKALLSFHLWVNMKFTQGTDLSKWELEECEIKN